MAEKKRQNINACVGMLTGVWVGMFIVGAPLYDNGKILKVKM
jgi:hypothetical protein